MNSTQLIAESTLLRSQVEGNDMTQVILLAVVIFIIGLSFFKIADST